MRKFSNTGQFIFRPSQEIRKRAQNKKQKITKNFRWVLTKLVRMKNKWSVKLCSCERHESLESGAKKFSIELTNKQINSCSLVRFSEVDWINNFSAPFHMFDVESVNFTSVENYVDVPSLSLRSECLFSMNTNTF